MPRHVLGIERRRYRRAASTSTAANRNASVVQAASENSSLVERVVQSGAQCVQQNNPGPMHVTGYADPRGTEEYNLALGDRRARAVRQYLGSLGVNVTSSSRGEEDATGTDEGSWSNDRRAEIGAR